MQVCRDKIRPEIIPYYETIRDAKEGRDVAVVKVSRGYHVHELWHNNHRTYYIRVGSTSREASSGELARLFQQRGRIRLELQPISGSDLLDFDLRRLRDYFTRVRRQAVPDTEDIDAWLRFLINTEIMVEEAGQASATMAGILLFGKNPKRLLPQSGIDAVAYPGREKDYAARERSSLRGPLVPLLNSDGDLVENGLAEQAVQFVHRNTEVLGELQDGARRVERRTYPEAVIREALVNALIHRDYAYSGTDIELSIYQDRLEIISPGRLPNGITVDRMRTGCRATRNQLLKDVMRDYGYLEHMGMGVPLKIIRGMREHNGTEPDLLARESDFVLRLWRSPEDRERGLDQ